MSEYVVLQNTMDQENINKRIQEVMETINPLVKSFIENMTAEEWILVFLGEPSENTFRSEQLLLEFIAFITKAVLKLQKNMNEELEKPLVLKVSQTLCANTQQIMSSTTLILTAYFHEDWLCRWEGRSR